MRTRKLELRSERVTELTAAELDAVAGGSALTCYCPTVDYDCVEIDIRDTVTCLVPTWRTCTT